MVEVVAGLSQAGAGWGGWARAPNFDRSFNPMPYLNRGHFLPNSILRALLDFQTLQRPFAALYVAKPE